MDRFELDNHTVMVGNIVTEDASFDHEFGCERAESTEVEDFAIIVYIDNMEYDVTSSFNMVQIEYFKTKFIEKIKG